MENNIVEITKDHSTENTQKLFRAFYASESTNIICIKQSQNPPTEKSFVVEKGAGFTHAQTGGCWHREARDEQTRNRKFCVIS